MSTDPARLITQPPSTDCETGRWLLDHYGIPYREERHTPFFLFGALRKAGDTNQFPLYRHNELTLAGWQAIFNHFEAKAEPQDRLMPQDEAAAEALRKQIEHFYLIFAEEAPKWAFWQMLPSHRLTNTAFAFGAPWYERLIVNGLYFSVRVIMVRGLHTGQEIADAAIVKLRAAFDELDALLADGRPYLAGEHFSLLDLVVCANAGLCLMPAEYGAPLPALQSLPAEASAEISALRDRPAGQYILRLFAERRRPVVI